MKISLMVPSGLGSRTGGYLYDRRLKEHLEKKGDVVRTFRTDRYPDDMKSLSDDVMDEDPDLVVQDGLGYRELERLNRHLGENGISPIVAVMHDPASMLVSPDEREGVSKTERAYLKTVDALIVNSMTTLKDIVRTTGTSKPYVVANPGRDNMDSGDTWKWGPDEGPPVKVLAVGNLNRNKGYLAMMEALSNMRSSKWKLTVAGSTVIDPEYAREVRDRVREKGLNSSVEFAGHLDHSELRELYAGSDVFLSTSMYEGWGMANVEAMGFSLPVVCSDRGATNEYLDNCRNGFLVDPDDPKGVASLLDELVSDRSLRLKIGREARRRFDDLPTWKESMEIASNFLSRLERDFNERPS